LKSQLKVTTRNDQRRKEYICPETALKSCLIFDYQLFFEFPVRSAIGATPRGVAPLTSEEQDGQAAQ
jgi:hypothetical protein